MLVLKFICLVTIGLSQAKCAAGEPYYRHLNLRTKYSKLMQIETGYGNSFWMPFSLFVSEKSIKQRSKEIHCGYRHIALTVMRICRYLIKWYVSDEQVSRTTDRMSSFGRLASRMLAVLYHIEIEQLQEMWMFYAYMAEIGYYWQELKKTTENSKQAFAKLNRLHGDVTNELERRLKRCCPKADNQFDIMNPRMRLFEIYESLETLPCHMPGLDPDGDLFNMFADEIEDTVILAECGDVDAASVRSFSIDRVLLNGLAVSNDRNLLDLQSVYDGRISWGDSAQALRSAFSRIAHKPIDLNEMFAPVESYHDTFKCIIKTIVLRVVWTHVLLLNVQVDRGYPAEGVPVGVRLQATSTTMVGLLYEIVRTTGLENDECLTTVIAYLTSCTGLFGGNQRILVDRIKQELRAIGSGFENFNAMDNVLDPLDKRELGRVYARCMEFAGKNNYTQNIKQCAGSTTSAMEMNNTRALILLNHVSKLLNDVDFDVLRTMFLSEIEIEDVTEGSRHVESG